MPIHTGASFIGVHKNTNVFIPKPCKPKDKHPTPTLHLPCRDFTSNSLGASDVKLGQYVIFFENFFDDACLFLVKSHMICIRQEDYMDFVFVCPPSSSV
jgi:hypothetical protein